MNSMTGFAFAEVAVGEARLTAELKSYNNRYLDLIVSLPAVLSPWEPRLRDQLSEVLARGRIEATFRVRESADSGSISVDEPLARRVGEALRRLRRVSGVRRPVGLEQVAAFPGVLRTTREVDPAAAQTAAQGLLQDLLADLKRTRQSEGERLKTDLMGQLETITAGRIQIAAQSSSLETLFRETLERRFRELAAETDENRIHTETAVLLVRYGINEELVRLESHETLFRQLLDEPGPVGKKLDFLCQELGREINTIGSKTPMASVQQRVVAMKDALENLREQLRNVE